MAISLNGGTGVITGVSVGGLPDGVVDLGTLSATNAVLQVVTVNKTDTWSSTLFSWVDITGLSVAITPSLSTSKVLVMYSMFVGNSTAGGYGGHLRLLRDSTAINIGDADGACERASGGMFTQGNNYPTHLIAGSFLDSPSTTSSTTYKFQAFSSHATYTTYIGKNGQGTGVNFARFPSMITLMEIGA